MPVNGLFNNTIDLLAKSVDLRTREHNLISSNLANAETPGYTPKTLQFEESLQKAVKKSTVRQSSSPSITHPAHIPLKGSADSISQVRGTVIDMPAVTPGRDRNAVELENEMSRMMQNQVLFNASTQLLSKKFDSLRTSLREGK